MSLKITRSQETRFFPIFNSVIEDIKGGGTLGDDFPATTLDITGGLVVGIDGDGIYHAVKTGEVNADAEGVSIDLETAQVFKVGDFICNGVKSTLITAIDLTTDTSIATLTLTNALTVTDGDILYQSVSEGLEDDDIAYKYTPVGMTKNEVLFSTQTVGTGPTRGENFGISIVVRGWAKESLLPFKVTSAMKTALPKGLYVN